MNTIILYRLSVVVIIALMCLYNPLLADEHSRQEVRDVIGKVEKKIIELKNQGAESYSLSELNRIQDQIKNAEGFLKKGNSDKAYYEIRIGVEYFNLIKARKRLLDTKSAYDRLNTNSNR